MPEPITIIVCSDCGEPINDPDTTVSQAGVMFGTSTTWEDHLAEGCGPQPMPASLLIDASGNLVVAQWQPELGDTT